MIIHRNFRRLGQQDDCHPAVYACKLISMGGATRMPKFGSEWAKLSDGERVAHCRQAAREAEQRAATASPDLRSVYDELAEHFWHLAAEIERCALGIKKPHAPSAHKIGGATCRQCGDTGWVCENHPNRPWGGASDQRDACACGAGAPCALCNTEDSPEVRWETPRIA